MTYTGSKYKVTENLPLKEIAKLVRADIKRELPYIKTSVQCEHYSMGRSINIHITEAPFSYYNQASLKEHFEHLNDYHCNPKQTEEAENALAKIRSILEEYNRDDSDPMTDYYNVHFSTEVAWDSTKMMDEYEKAEARYKKVKV